MLRIIGTQRSGDPTTEFVLLQNQCSLKTPLRGHVLISEEAMVVGDLQTATGLLSDDVCIPAGAYVLVSSGIGESHWTRSKDGSLLYCVYMNRKCAVWTDGSPIHLLAPQHSFVERKELVSLA